MIRVEALGAIRPNVERLLVRSDVFSLCISIVTASTVYTAHAARKQTIRKVKT
jgi:hypothetical protein